MADIEAIVGEFEAVLSALSVACAGRPEEEVRRLWQLALERESLVAVAYRRDIIGSRLGRMPIDEDTRRVVGRAIRWAWRDEEMHALWIRGVLLREGDRSERLRAWASMVEGRVAGWTSSRQSHYRWSEAPIRRMVAEILEVGGRFSGRIPGSVSGELHFQCFRDYCHFNIAAERTAELAWRRMLELAADPEALVSAEDAEAFRRIAEDEVRHGKMFTILAKSFSSEDTLLPEVEVDTLRLQLAQVGQRFLTAPTPGDSAWQNPLGKGAPVVIREGEHEGAVLAEVLEAVGFEVSRGLRVAIKTSFMFGVDKADVSPVVSTPLLHALTRALRDQGAEVSVIESQNIYDRFHGRRGVHEVAEYFGIVHDDFEICDAQDDQAAHPYLRGFGQGTACQTWRDADVRIALGKLRSHPSDLAMLTLGVTEGLGGRHDAFSFSDRKVDRHTVVLALLDALPPHLAILDAFSDVPDGLTGMMGSRHPLQPRRVYASRDAVSLDVVVAGHLGADPEKMLVGAAFDWFGDPRERLSIDGIDTPIAGWKAPDASPSMALLSALALPMWDHASARGALFIPPMDTAAFPPLESAGALFEQARAAAQRITAAGSRASPVEALLPTEQLWINGRSLRIHRSGEGPCVVLLHGYPENLQLFSRLARLLRGFEVLAFDWPGQGYSEPFAGETGPEAMSTQLLSILDHLGLQRVHLVATDMGCHPALVTAAMAPDRIARVVVMNALLFGDGPTSWEISAMRRSGLNRAAFRLTPGIVWRRCVQTFMDEPLPGPHTDDMWGAFRKRAVREQLIALCDSTELALPTLPDLYWKVRSPVLALWGEAETHFPLDQAQRLADIVPSSRVQSLPEASHWMVWSHAAEVASSIHSFLTEAYDGPSVATEGPE